MIEIPLLSGAPRQSQITTLDGRRYDLAFDWNGRIERWFFSLATESGVFLLRAKGLMVGADVLRQIRHMPEAPPGVLVLFDAAHPPDAIVEADLYSLGREHGLFYLPANP